MSRPSCGLLGTTYRRSRAMSTISSGLVRERSNRALGSGRKLPAITANVSRRGYTRAVEDTNKGVVGAWLPGEPCFSY